jgi:hypothetical protein
MQNNAGILNDSTAWRKVTKEADRFGNFGTEEHVILSMESR